MHCHCMHSAQVYSVSTWEDTHCIWVGGICITDWYLGWEMCITDRYLGWGDVYYRLVDEHVLSPVGYTIQMPNMEKLGSSVLILYLLF